MRSTAFCLEVPDSRTSLILAYEMDLIMPNVKFLYLNSLAV